MPHRKIQDLGKGAIRDSVDARDFQIMGQPSFNAALVTVDWVKGFFNAEPESEDQNGSLSCVGQGWSYLHDQIRPTPFKKSRRDLYSRIFIPGGGAQIRDGGIQIVNIGHATRDKVPDPTPETEQAMEDKTGVNATVEADYKELASFVVPMDINSWAAGIQVYNGIVGGLEGTNAGWQNMANPRPPQDGDPGQIWGHALYFFGYHTHDGQKCVVAKSSWGNAGNTTVHHIKNNYFVSGHMFNAWTLIPKGDIRMLIFFQVKGSTTIWSLMDGEWVGFADMPTFNKYIDGRPNVVIALDQVEFAKVKANPDVFKS